MNSATLHGGDKIVTTAILDRVLHHSHIINIQGDSYRLKEQKEAGKLDLDLFKNKEKSEGSLSKD